jgi:hypothetical protein
MVWDLLRTKKEKPAAGKTGYWRTFWRRRWDSNPRTLADQLISRFYSNPPKTGSFRPFKTIVEKFVNAKIMLFSLFLPVGKNRGKNSGKNKIRRILI